MPTGRQAEAPASIAYTVLCLATTKSSRETGQKMSFSVQLNKGR